MAKQVNRGRFRVMTAAVLEIVKKAEARILATQEGANCPCGNPGVGRAKECDQGLPDTVRIGGAKCGCRCHIQYIQCWCGMSCPSNYIHYPGGEPEDGPAHRPEPPCEQCGMQYVKNEQGECEGCNQPDELPELGVVIEAIRKVPIEMRDMVLDRFCRDCDEYVPPKQTCTCGLKPTKR